MVPIHGDKTASRRRVRALELGLLFWLLLAPGDRWSWVIVGGHDSRDACEHARFTRLDPEYLICASTEHPPLYSSPETDDRWWSHISRRTPSSSTDGARARTSDHTAPARNADGSRAR